MNTLSIILIGISVVIASLVNISQSGRIDALQEQVASLHETQYQQVATQPTVPPAHVAPKGISDLLRAMAIVESGSTADSDVLGDNGRSLGPLQIGQAYWTDANMPDGDYEDCTSYDYACRVAVKYWMRYCHEALCERDYATLARIHNGGPRGHCKKTTLKYWAKVQKELQ